MSEMLIIFSNGARGSVKKKTLPAVRHPVENIVLFEMKDRLFMSKGR
jgi:hypothetical protein